MKIALGSDRVAKINGVVDCAARIATIDDRWTGAEVIARPVTVSVPAMPLTDEELMTGAEERAFAVRSVLNAENISADLYVGLEGGFHSTTFGGKRITFLRGWAFVTNGEAYGIGASPSILVPQEIAERVIREGIELGVVIDEVAGEADVRSRQGAWGVLSRDLLTRSMSFEAALIAAFAPFYNGGLYGYKESIEWKN